MRKLKQMNLLLIKQTMMLLLLLLSLILPNLSKADLNESFTYCERERTAAESALMLCDKSRKDDKDVEKGLLDQLVTEQKIMSVQVTQVEASNKEIVELKKDVNFNRYLFGIGGFLLGILFPPLHLLHLRVGL